MWSKYSWRKMTKVFLLTVETLIRYLILHLHCLPITLFGGLQIKILFYNYNYGVKAPFSSKIDIFIQERYNKLIYNINTTIKCGIWQPVKFHLVSRFWTGSKLKWFFYCISELMLATLIQKYYKKSFCFKNKRLSDILTGCQVPHFMIVLISYMYINLLNFPIFEE